MKHLNYIYKNQDGASSVLVMVMMIVLIAFGLAGFSLALSNERLADKKISWLSEYYAIESDANALLAEIYQGVENDNLAEKLATINKQDFNCITLEINPDEQGYNYLIHYTIMGGKKTTKYIEVKLGINLKGEKTVDVLSFKQHQDQFQIEGDSFSFE